MAGQLTLMDAVDAYQQGLDYGEKVKDRATRDAAGKAFNATLDGERTRWVESQKAQGIEASPDAFKPDQGHYFNAAQAASQEYARAGDWRGFMDQQVKLAPLRLQARASALQDYKMDGDLPRLVNRFYQTVPDGGAIQKIDMLDGTGPDGKPVGAKVRIQTSDGRTVIKTPDELLKSMTMAIQDPAKAAERDAELALFTAKQNVETAGKVRVEGAKGEEARKTEGVKHGYQVEQIGLKNAGQVAAVEARNRGELAAVGLRNAGEIAAVGARTAGEAGNIRLRAGLEDAKPYTLSEGETRYTVKDGKSVPVASVPKSGKRMTVPEMQAAAVHSFGDPKDGPMGGTRIGGEKTVAIAARANQIRTQNPDISDDQALMQAGAEYGHKYPSRTQVPGLGLSSATTAPGAAGDFSSLWK